MSEKTPWLSHSEPESWDNDRAEKKRPGQVVEHLLPGPRRLVGVAVNGILPPPLHPSQHHPEWADRFWAKVDVSTSANQCWLWTASAIHGYGQFNRSGWGTARAHRLSFLWVHGSIPDGLVLDHLCRVTRCVNPDHLEAVTDRENILRGTGRPALNARATHCIHGHELTSENLYTPPRGGRQCIRCMKRAGKENSARRPTESPDAGSCASCGRVRHVRRNGTMHKHRLFDGDVCAGSGQPPAAERPGQVA